MEINFRRIEPDLNRDLIRTFLSPKLQKLSQVIELLKIKSFGDNYYFKYSGLSINSPAVYYFGLSINTSV